MEKELERLRVLEKRIDALLKKGGSNRAPLFDAYAEAFFIYANHELYHRGLYYAERLVELLERDGEVTEELLLAWSNLSVFTQKTGDEQRSMELLTKILSVRSQDCGPESKEALECRIFTANLKISTGEVHEAIALLEANIEESKRYFSLDSHEMMLCYESLAVVYCNLFAYDMAESLLERYMEELSDKFGEHNLGYLDALRALADAYDLEGDYKSALIYRKERVRIIKEIGSLEDSYYIDSILSLSGTRVFAKEEIFEAIEDLIFVQNKIITAHPEMEDKLSSAISELAECYILVEDYEKAADCLYCIYAKTISWEGLHSEASRVVISRLSYAYSLAGKHENSIELLDNLYKEMSKKDGRYSHKALSALDELGQAYAEADRLNEAIECFRRLVEFREKSLWQTDEDITDAKSALASALMANGEYKEAATLFQGIIKKQRALYGYDDEIVIRLMVALSECYMNRGAKGDIKRAEKELLLALEHALFIQGPEGELSIKAKKLLDSII